MFAVVTCDGKLSTCIDSAADGGMRLEDTTIDVDAADEHRPAIDCRNCSRSRGCAELQDDDDDDSSVLEEGTCVC